MLPAPKRPRFGTVAAAALAARNGLLRTAPERIDKNIVKINTAILNVNHNIYGFNYNYHKRYSIFLQIAATMQFYRTIGKNGYSFK